MLDYFLFSPSDMSGLSVVILRAKICEQTKLQEFLFGNCANPDNIVI